MFETEATSDGPPRDDSKWEILPNQDRSVVTVPEPFHVFNNIDPSILVNDSECRKSSHPKSPVVTMPDNLSAAIHLQWQNEQPQLKTGGDKIDWQTLPGVTQRVRRCQRV